MRTFEEERSLWLQEAAAKWDAAARYWRLAAGAEGDGLPESAEQFRATARHLEEWAERYERWADTCGEPAAA